MGCALIVNPVRLATMIARKRRRKLRLGKIPEPPRKLSSTTAADYTLAPNELRIARSDIQLFKKVSR
jgi:hypothetical protein